MCKRKPQDLWESLWKELLTEVSNSEGKYLRNEPNYRASPCEKSIYKVSSFVYHIAHSVQGRSSNGRTAVSKTDG